MCTVSDLVVLIVEPNEEERKLTCKSLEKLGILKVICTETYIDAVHSIKENPEVDIVIADFAIEAGKALGLLLCSTMKKSNPGILFVLISKEYSCSVVLESIRIGAEDILDKNREGEIENLMQKWIKLAMQKNITKEILYGKAKE